MIRIILGVIVGFFAWAIVWFGSEKILSAIWPEVRHLIKPRSKRPIENGGQFTADTTHSSHAYCPRFNSLADVRISGRADRR